MGQCFWDLGHTPWQIKHVSGLKKHILKAAENRIFVGGLAAQEPVIRIPVSGPRCSLLEQFLI